MLACKTKFFVLKIDEVSPETTAESWLIIEETVKDLTSYLLFKMIHIRQKFRVRMDRILTSLKHGR